MYDPTFENRKVGKNSDSRKVYISDETILARQFFMDEMRNLHIRTHSYKNNGNLPRVTIPKKV